MLKKNVVFGFFGLIILATSGCAKSTSSTTSSSTDDTSASGTAASAASGALSASSSAGTIAMLHPSSPWEALIPSAFASNACPTFKTAAGAGCTQSSNSLWLTYNACSNGSSSATWSGTQLLQKNSGTATCGSFPLPVASGNLIRQMVTAASSTTPSTATRTNAAGKVVTIDDATANLGNFDNVSISSIANGGYGEQINFTGLVRSSITIARRFYTASYDHSITGTLTVSEGSSATSRTLNGTITIYHNLLQVIGTSTFTSVAHSDGCCTPTSGTITTTFSAGANVAPATAKGLAMVGKTETLKITACGAGTLTATDGTVTTVAMNNCF